MRVLLLVIVEFVLAVPHGLAWQLQRAYYLDFVRAVLAVVSL
jgi:hypothetical protein